MSCSLGLHMNPKRFLPLLLLPLLAAGCAHERVARVVGPLEDTASLKRCLFYWASNYSTNATNHFYAAAVKPGFWDFIYWKEERTLLEYSEPSPEVVPPPPESMCFHHDLKLDRDTADTAEESAHSSYVVTHRFWVEWMEKCLARGREYVITLDEARRVVPKQKATGEN